MRVVRQLGTWGTGAVLAPLFWLLACALARGLAQNAYDSSIVPVTRGFRMQAGPRVSQPSFPTAGNTLEDPRVRAELQKYLQVWSLEPGACAAFPDAARIPWCWNPFRPSALIMRLKQKQAFLLTQHHEVEAVALPGGQMRLYLAPDPQAALGGRRFLAEAQGGRLLRVVEL